MAKFIVEDVSPIERRIRVEVEPELVAVEMEKTYRQLSRQVRIPGFRPGKVPRRILETRFKQQVETDVIQHLVEHTYREAIEKHPEVMPVAAPRVTSEELKPGEPFRYQAQVEVKPKVEAKDYEGLELKPVKVEIADSRIDEELEQLRKAFTDLAPVEGRTAAEKGDIAVVSFEGTLDGKPVKGAKGENVNMEIGPGEFAEGNAEFLAGAQVGETREMDYTFPTGYRLAELAAKTLHFTVKLQGLKTRHVPGLDDELAKNLGAQSLEDLKKRIREDLTHRETDKAEREEREQLMKQLVERNPIEIPNGMVERRMDVMLETTLEGLARQGIDPRQMRLDFDRIREGMRDSAVAQVKGALLLESISAKEKIEVAQTDLDAKLQQIADRAKAPIEKVRAQLDGETENSLRMSLRDEKALAFLKSKAKIAQS